MPPAQPKHCHRPRRPTHSCCARTENLQPSRSFGHHLLAAAAAAMDKHALSTFSVSPVPQIANKRPANFDRHSSGVHASHFSTEIIRQKPLGPRTPPAYPKSIVDRPVRKSWIVVPDIGFQQVDSPGHLRVREVCDWKTTPGKDEASASLSVICGSCLPRAVSIVLIHAVAVPGASTERSKESRGPT